MEQLTLLINIWTNLINCVYLVLIGFYWLVPISFLAFISLWGAKYRKPINPIQFEYRSYHVSVEMAFDHNGVLYRANALMTDISFR